MPELSIQAVIAGLLLVHIDGRYPLLTIDSSA